MIQHGGYRKKGDMATMCVISFQIATPTENSCVLKTRRLFQGRLDYLNPPSVTFAHKTCILKGFEGGYANQPTNHVKLWVGNAEQTYS